MKVGYARVSTMDQNLGRQLEVLENAGADESLSRKNVWEKHKRLRRI